MTDEDFAALARRVAKLEDKAYRLKAEIRRRDAYLFNMIYGVKEVFWNAVTCAVAFAVCFNYRDSGWTFGVFCVFIVIASILFGRRIDERIARARLDAFRKLEGIWAGDGD